eukprot:GHVL01003044.1.p1 GENE.GHVL01003044.1~~GHVL01003044.1.p1  ORF type:complete len:488 (+),score=88.98 GHVL01003044.1:136-1599(+)
MSVKSSNSSRFYAFNTCLKIFFLYFLLISQCVKLRYFGASNNQKNDDPLQSENINQISTNFVQRNETEFLSPIVARSEESLLKTADSRTRERTKSSSATSAIADVLMENIRSERIQMHLQHLSEIEMFQSAYKLAMWGDPFDDGIIESSWFYGSGIRPTCVILNYSHLSRNLWLGNYLSTMLDNDSETTKMDKNILNYSDNIGYIFTKNDISKSNDPEVIIHRHESRKTISNIKNNIYDISDTICEKEDNNSEDDNIEVHSRLYENDPIDTRDKKSVTVQPGCEVEMWGSHLFEGGKNLLKNPGNYFVSKIGPLSVKPAGCVKSGGSCAEEESRLCCAGYSCRVTNVGNRCSNGEIDDGYRNWKSDEQCAIITNSHGIYSMIGPGTYDLTIYEFGVFFNDIKNIYTRDGCIAVNDSGKDLSEKMIEKLTITKNQNHPTQTVEKKISDQITQTSQKEGPQEEQAQGPNLSDTIQTSQERQISQHRPTS